MPSTAGGQRRFFFVFNFWTLKKSTSPPRELHFACLPHRLLLAKSAHVPFPSALEVVIVGQSSLLLNSHRDDALESDLTQLFSLDSQDYARSTCGNVTLTKLCTFSPRPPPRLPDSRIHSLRRQWMLMRRDLGYLADKILPVFKQAM